MKGSILIFGGNAEIRKEKINEIIESLQLRSKSPDAMFLKRIENKKSIGINQVREAIKFLNERPFESKNKALVIEKAHLLTDAAQNALLKTLEEPPEYASIVLTTKSEEDVLPTIVSRCKRIHILKTETKIEGLDPIDKILKMTVGERLAWAEKAAKEDREIVVSMLEGWILDERELLSKEDLDLEDVAINIGKILEIRSDLEKTNVNQRLALEYLCIKLS